jgi:hypothetical protein
MPSDCLGQSGRRLRTFRLRAALMPFRLSLHNRFLRCLTGLFLLLPALPGHAFNACVSTAQQLHDALDAVATTTDANVQIKLRTGTYTQTAATGPFRAMMNQPNQTVEISGGWSGVTGLCQTSSLNPADTVLVGPATLQTLVVTTGNAVSGNVLNVRDLTLSNTAYTGLGFSACLAATVTPGNEVLLERLQMVECLAPNSNYAAGLLRNTGGQLTARNLYVRSSVAKNGGGLSVQTYEGGTSRLAHLSITNTTSTAADSQASGLSIANYSDSTTYLSNSVIWGNDPDPDTADLYSFGTGVFLTRVHSGKLVGIFNANISPGSGDPGFVSYNNPRLRPDSILIDSGVASPQGGSGTSDADGRTRVLGAGVDVGAFESEFIFANGFQTVP